MNQSEYHVRFSVSVLHLAKNLRSFNLQPTSGGIRTRDMLDPTSLAVPTLKNPKGQASPVQTIIVDSASLFSFFFSFSISFALETLVCRLVAEFSSRLPACLFGTPLKPKTLSKAQGRLGGSNHTRFLFLNLRSPKSRLCNSPLLCAHDRLGLRQRR